MTSIGSTMCSNSIDYCSANLFLALTIVLTLTLRDVLAQCLVTDDHCEFRLVVTQTMTMMHGGHALYAHNGRLYRDDVPEGEINDTTPHIPPDQTVIADGWEVPRYIVAVNGSFPGPTIEAYEGQTVTVHVTNKLTSDGVAVHWHGIHQKDTPWMDGVAFITQCPVPPRSTFTYRWKADPKGSHWYHSHLGSQVGNGMFGALVIHERKAKEMDEHIMMIQEWNHDWDADIATMRMTLGSYVNRTEKYKTKSLEGGIFSNFLFQSGLINGRGRYFAESGKFFRQTPLTVYDVEQGKKYRFRVYGAGNVYLFRVSVEGHPVLQVVAADGYDLQPFDVESFVVNPGERIDFIVEANQAVDNYWVRADSLEVDVVNHVALAIMRYKRALEADPIDRKRPCKASYRCVVFNCPFKYYPADSYTDCKSFGEAKALHVSSWKADESDEVEEVFLNFAFPGPDKINPGTTNGMHMVMPPSPPLTQPKQFTTVCTPEDDCGEQKICKCTMVLDLKLGKVYQMVMTNLGSGKGWAHPIHTHGHSYQVLKMGFPSYNKTTGRVLESNKDIDCQGGVPEDKSFCNNPTWSNRTWGGNNVPGMDLTWAPLKDTLIVPTGGYAVIRLKANNPGVWLMHCHIGLHAVDGMAFLLNESFENQPAPPKDFPTCGDFYNEIRSEDTAATTSAPTQGSTSRPGDGASSIAQSGADDEYCAGPEVFWPVLAAFIIVIILQLIINVCLHRRNQSKST